MCVCSILASLQVAKKSKSRNLLSLIMAVICYQGVIDVTGGIATVTQVTERVDSNLGAGADFANLSSDSGTFLSWGLLKSDETSNSRLLIRVLKEANSVNRGLQSGVGIFALFD